MGWVHLMLLHNYQEDLPSLLHATVAFDCIIRQSERSMSDDLLQHLMLDIDEEDEMEEDLIIILLSTELTMSNRHDPYFRARMRWANHVSALDNEGPGAFYLVYRMHYGSFIKLCSFIENNVKKIIIATPLLV